MCIRDRLLPEYVSEELTWEQLQKMREGSMESLNVTLSTSNPVTEINREEKYLIDSKGEKHEYDIVLMATGSRAFVPKEVPAEPLSANTPDLKTGI